MEWVYETADGKVKPIKKWHFVLHIVWSYAATRIAPDGKGYISKSQIASSLQHKLPSMTTSRVWQILKMCQMNGWVECKKSNERYIYSLFPIREIIRKYRGRPKLFWRLTDRGENYWHHKTNLFKKISKILSNTNWKIVWR